MDKSSMPLLQIPHGTFSSSGLRCDEQINTVGVGLIFCQVVFTVLRLFESFGSIAAFWAKNQNKMFQ